MLTSVGRASGCAVKFIFVFILEDFAMKDWPHTFTLEDSLWLLKLPREPGQLSSKYLPRGHQNLDNVCE